mmetsp:Transcript_38260/g.101886  ORF Transcript_38260/g.101886 Transcript_38260/m.101886 type:complete len:113 (-) Transcript_38260:27-365(-)
MQNLIEEDAPLEQACENYESDGLVWLRLFFVLGRGENITSVKDYLEKPNGYETIEDVFESRDRYSIAGHVAHLMAPSLRLKCIQRGGSWTVSSLAEHQHRHEIPEQQSHDTL